MEEPTVKVMEENKKIFAIAQNILKVIEGEPFDDLIPALTMVLADVGVGSEVEINKYLDFISDSVKKIVITRKAIEKMLEEPSNLH
jgi:hypothetical protein